jgi:UDP-2,3-diacylglucosamine hydrolase
MRSLFISDLHLDATRPDISRAFFRFLDEQARGADALYILGDFFESWIGDDDQSPLIDKVAEALRQLSDSGTHLYIMHGNRDFLLGPAFCARAGAELLPDPCVIELNGQTALLMHGDSLCTGDSDYIQLRTMLRSPQWQQDILNKPLEERRQLARQLRMASSEANSNKAEDIMDVSPDAVVAALQAHDCALLIHGHTHRPATHSLNTQTGPAERIVLGDWDSQAYFLVAQNGALALKPFPVL